MLILWCCWRPLLAKATGCCSVMAIVNVLTERLNDRRLVVDIELDVSW